MGVTLYHFPPSLCSQKVRLALTEKGVPWESHLINIGPPMENYEPWYAAINSRLVVPSLDHDGKVVTDSAQIVRYVDQAFSGANLIPEDDVAREQMHTWIDRQDDLSVRELSYARTGNPFVNRIKAFANARRIRRLRGHMEAHPELREIYSAKLRDIQGLETEATNPDRVDAMRREFQSTLDDLEATLQNHRFIAGDNYTLADVVWTVVTARLQMLGFGDWIATRPALSGWYNRMRARPSFDEADVWDRLKPTVMLPIIARVFAPALLAVAALTILALLIYAGLT